VAIPDISDGPLALTRRRFDNSVHALADPVPVWDHGVCRWSDSLYVRLRGAITARTAGRRRVMAGSRAPCRTDVLVWLIEVDSTVAGWEPDSKGDTVERLHQLSARGFRPQDCGLIDDYCGQIERWVIGAAELLGDRQVAVALRLPCPACGARWTYRRNGSEQIRSWALKVSESGCSCSGCQAFWPPDRFEFLAQLLNCAPLP